MTLTQELDSIKEQYGPDFFRDLVPDHIVANLREDFSIRPYQMEAFGRFMYLTRTVSAQSPIHLLYHMATGSGKTLVMAGLIIQLYTLGYRNFLFFVNSTNIIEKTKDNFLNPRSAKYLFAPSVSIDGRRVRISQAYNFQNSDPDGINICFSTVQGLHSALSMPRENSITYQDFQGGKLVMIADEAHHINAITKSGKASSADADNSWETTVARIFQSNPGNVMLEFTATANLGNRDIAQKYHDKLIYNYPLREFRADGYSKEVNTIESGLTNVQRSIQAILLSQYRKKLFQDHGIAIKPVVLFKSKTIKESKDFQKQFTERIKLLSPNDLETIRQSSDSGILDKAFAYFSKHGIAPENLCMELRCDFDEARQISVNSAEESEDKQIAINTLEDSDNPYRAVFAVDKLNEGWDVLNLFDIVRLYDTRDSRNGIPGKTTMQEAQLIGRGARYCPFSPAPGLPANIRKYDQDPGHELRVCEELYYHASYNPQYISELKTALKEIGIMAKHENGTLATRKTPPTKGKYHSSDIQAFAKATEGVTISASLSSGISRQENISPADIEERIWRDAIGRLNFFRFGNLRKYLARLESTSEFLHSDIYMGRLTITVSGHAHELKALSPEQKLQIAIQTLAEIASILRNNIII